MTDITISQAPIFTFPVRFITKILTGHLLGLEHQNPAIGKFYVLQETIGRRILDFNFMRCSVGIDLNKVTITFFFTFPSNVLQIYINPLLLSFVNALEIRDAALAFNICSYHSILYFSIYNSTCKYKLS